MSVQKNDCAGEYCFSSVMMHGLATMCEWGIPFSPMQPALLVLLLLAMSQIASTLSLEKPSSLLQRMTRSPRSVKGSAGMVLLAYMLSTAFWMTSMMKCVGELYSSVLNSFIILPANPRISSSMLQHKKDRLRSLRGRHRGTFGPAIHHADDPSPSQYR
jgi:hypothetical protein